ncbi:hypothetical protein ACUYQI_000656 [Salmonella enterica subsp. enterica serovar Braenderup]
MNYEIMSDEELQTSLESVNFIVQTQQERIKHIENTLKEHINISNEINVEIDKRKISKIIYASLEEQFKFFSTEISSYNTTYMYHKCKQFFNVMKLEKTEYNFRWYASCDYIKNKRDDIKQYLNYAFFNCNPILVMESFEGYHIEVVGDHRVHKIMYYPSKNLYCAEGTYLRQYKTIDELLDYMLEDTIC